ncbi:MAG TPA: hypothetical protein VJK02_24855 [Anaerolineales bacterium]|nr:hypothetical protein [Anaerolineales bacterium]
MRRFLAQVESIGLYPSGQSGLRVATPARDVPRPGQPFLALQPGKSESTRTVLYPFELTPHGFLCIAPPDRIWRPGDELDLLGPIGPGFKPPPATRRWLLLSVDTEAEPLLPLIRLANARGAAISLWASAIPSDLPPDVEVATDLPASLDWADFVAVNATPAGLPELRRLLPLRSDLHIGVRAQALIVGPMPCGIGGCMACAVRARRGWKLACLDGPVFPVEDLAW